MLAIKNLDKGQIIVSGLAFDPKWSTLPTLTLMVVLAQAMVGRTRETSGRYVTAGEPVVDLPLLGDKDEVHIVSRVGDPLNRTYQPGQELPVFPRSGAYLIQIGQEPFCLSVCSAHQEGIQRFLESSPIPAVKGLSHTVRKLEETDLTQAQAASRGGLLLYLPFLLLAMLALVTESLLGAPPGKKTVSDQQSTIRP